MSTPEERKSRLQAYATEQAARAKRLKMDARLHEKRIPVVTSFFFGDEALDEANDAVRAIYQRHTKRLEDDAKMAAAYAKAARSLAKSESSQEHLIDGVERYDRMKDCGRIRFGGGVSASKEMAALGRRGLMRSQTSGGRISSTAYRPTDMGRALVDVMEGHEPS